MERRVPHLVEIEEESALPLEAVGPVECHDLKRCEFSVYSTHQVCTMHVKCVQRTSSVYNTRHDLQTAPKLWAPHTSRPESGSRRKSNLKRQAICLYRKMSSPHTVLPTVGRKAPRSSFFVEALRSSVCYTAGDGLPWRVNFLLFRDGSICTTLICCD